MSRKQKVSYLLATVIFLFLFWEIFKDFNQIKSIHWRLGAKDTIILMLVLLSGPFINALSWHLYTKSLGGEINFIDNIKIWTLSNATRFVPGSIWQYAGRVYMLSQKGVSKTFTTTALLLEALFNIGVACMIVFLTLRLFPLATLAFTQKGLIPLFLSSFIILIFFTGSRIKVLEKVIKQVLKSDEIKLNKIKIRWIPVILLSVSVQFILTGLALWLVALGLGVETQGGIFSFIGIYAASWLLGYLSFLAPSGLGIREASIAGLMSFYVPLVVGSLVAILFRLATLVSEALMVVIIFLFLPKNST